MSLFHVYFLSSSTLMTCHHFTLKTTIDSVKWTLSTHFVGMLKNTFDSETHMHGSFQPTKFVFLPSTLRSLLLTLWLKLDFLLYILWQYMDIFFADALPLSYPDDSWADTINSLVGVIIYASPQHLPMKMRYTWKLHYSVDDNYICKFLSKLLRFLIRSLICGFFPNKK